MNELLRHILRTLLYALVFLFMWKVFGFEITVLMGLATIAANVTDKSDNKQ